MRKKGLNLLTLVVLFCTISIGRANSQALPDRPVPQKLVNDFAGLLGSEETGRLEQKLVAFNDSTSTQIAIVIVKDLNGYDKADYAQRLAEKWGVGQKGKNNGVLILVKTKTSDAKGEVFITQGYGLEGVIPDITCSAIVDNDILPAFRNSSYFDGLNKATNTLISLARGEFSAADYGHKGKKSGEKGIPVGFIIVVVFIIIAMISRKSGGSNNKHIGTGGLPFWLLLGGMMNSGRGSSSGSWGGFSGGSSGGGGFGGFGGGSFGGGGAGGSW